jgi:DNA excision repair protein ERCC-2
LTINASTTKQKAAAGTEAQVATAVASGTDHSATLAVCFVAHSVAVRALCEFAAKRGDLDTRFTPSPSGKEGIAAHQWVQRKRAKHYEAELSLQGQIGSLLLRGRADGYDPRKNRLEEIKTHLGDAKRIPEHHQALHWAQAKVYGALLCTARNLESIELCLVYIDYLSLKETLLTQDCTAEELQQFALELAKQYATWHAEQELHRTQRNTYLGELKFPFEQFRPGQGDMARAIYAAGTRSLNGGEFPNQVLIQAPTGIGKTLASLFGALRAMPVAPLDKLFYLTPKNSGKTLAWHGLEKILNQPNSAEPVSTNGTIKKPLRILELIAKEKACEFPANECHPLSCPLALGFYDRLAGARQQATQHGWLNQSAIREIALAHQICPYYLSQEMVRWVDVVIGDYNYYCDSSAMLFGLSAGLDWQVAVLLDEAHNVLERSRSMYSAQIEQSAIKLLRKQAPRLLRSSFVTLDKAWTSNFASHQLPYSVLPDLPRSFIESLNKLVRKVMDYFVQYPAEQLPVLKDFMFKAMQLITLAEQVDQHSLIDVTRSAPLEPIVLSIRNIIPAKQLAPRWNYAKLTVLFSATLTPMQSVVPVLGLRADTLQLDIPAPFTADQLSVSVTKHLSTRFNQREKSLHDIASIIATQYREQSGNYIAFFSSYSYMQNAYQCLVDNFPDIPVCLQHSKMSDVEQQDYLAQFTEQSQQVGFAVLGGSFSEGIDLPGRRLIGAFIATLGMPQLNEINDQFKLRMEQLLGDGFDRVYLYPGLQKVVQAAGRVIRTPQDRGTIWLLDERYAKQNVRALLPSWWVVKIVE